MRIPQLIYLHTRTHLWVKTIFTLCTEWQIVQEALGVHLQQLQREKQHCCSAATSSTYTMCACTLKKPLHNINKLGTGLVCLEALTVKHMEALAFSGEEQASLRGGLYIFALQAFDQQRKSERSSEKTSNPPPRHHPNG